MPDQDPYNEIMTVTEYLQRAENTVLRMPQAEKIPATRIAGHWPFMRPAIRDWRTAQMHVAPVESPDKAAPARRVCRPPAKGPVT